MLVLTRKKNERVIINGTISVEVIAIAGDKVRLGIVAPSGISVDRQEIHDAKRAEKARRGTEAPREPW